MGIVMGLQKCIFVGVLHACLQVELSTLKRYFIKDKIRSIEPGGDNYSPDGRRHAIDSLYVVRAGRRHRLQPEGVSQTSYPLVTCMGSLSPHTLSSLHSSHSLIHTFYPHACSVGSVFRDNVWFGPSVFSQPSSTRRYIASASTSLPWSEQKLSRL